MVVGMVCVPVLPSFSLFPEVGRMDRDVQVMANKGQSRGEQERAQQVGREGKRKRRSTRPLRGRDEPALSTTVEYEDYIL